MAEVVRQFVDNVAASPSDTRLLTAVVVACGLAVVLALLGFGLLRAVGLDGAERRSAESAGIYLGVGLVSGASIWAAIWSGGRSVFTPVAGAIAVAALIGIARRWRTPRADSAAADRTRQPTAGFRARFLVVAASGAFLAIISLIYASTTVPVARGGEQPVEFADEAYYAVLASDLERTGTESIYSPAGFDELPSLPTQTWYHWGELWLAAATIFILGIEPIPALHLIVLPILLLAAVLLTGSLVQRFGRTNSRWAFLVGAASCLFLAPIPAPGPFFNSWARGGIFGITTYGLALVVVLLLAALLARPTNPAKSMAVTVLTGALIGSLLPAHIVIAGVGLAGVMGAMFVAIVWFRDDLRRFVSRSARLRSVVATTSLIVASTIVWGVITGHGIGTTGTAAGIEPFGDTWRQAILVTTIGGGMLLAIPVVLWLLRKDRDPLFWVATGVLATMAVGAIAWGARLADFTMFHAYFGSLAVFATPAAAVAAWTIWRRLRTTGHLQLAVGVVALCVAQLELGVGSGLARLHDFGPHAYAPVPVAILDEMRALPEGSRFAYACSPVEESAFWNANLSSYTAHTSRPVVPMCFQSAVLAWLTGAEPSTARNPLFERAPQRSLYPTFDASPPDSAVLAFLRDQGIRYLLVDPRHQARLIPNARTVVVVDGFEILEVP